jgi:hypothetical protein
LIFLFLGRCQIDPSSACNGTRSSLQTARSHRSTQFEDLLDDRTRIFAPLSRRDACLSNWSPMNASLVETGRAAPTYLYLDANYVLVSLDSFCTQPPSSMIVPSITLTPTQHLLQPPDALRLVAASLRDVQRSQPVARVVEAIARTPRHLRGTEPGQQLFKSSKKRPIDLSEDEDGESTSTKKVRRESEVVVKRKGGPAKSKKK